VAVPEEVVHGQGDQEVEQDRQEAGQDLQEAGQDLPREPLLDRLDDHRHGLPEIGRTLIVIKILTEMSIVMSTEMSM